MSDLLSTFSSMLKPKGMEFVEVKNLSFGSLENGIIPVNLTAILKNPNNLSVYLDKINFDLYCWGTKIGETHQSPEMEVVANNTFELPLRITLNAGMLQEKLKNDFLNIFSNGNIIIPVRMDGKASIKKFGFCLDIPLDITKEIQLTLDQLLSKIKI